MNPSVQDTAWEFMKANWLALKEKVGPRGATQVIASAAALQTPALRAELEAFFKKPENQVPIAAKKLAQSLDAIDVALRFRAEQSQALERWLESKR